MKTEKNRLQRVLIIGATPAGIAAANKLGEIGIPVTLTDTEPDIDKKLSNEKWRLPSGLTFNYALRPSLIRILRNPDIRTILPCEITSIRNTPQGFRARLKQIQTFIDAERCTLCGRCLDICPVLTKNGIKAIHFHSRQSLPGRPVIDKRPKPLCQEACPLGVNAQGYIALAKQGKYQTALDLIRRENVLPGICGRICTHPCEDSCRRNELDDPIAIKDIKSFLTDDEIKHSRIPAIKQVPDNGFKIAVIGSGPSGLAAAADLAKAGCKVTVFEKEPLPGGLLRYAIGPYRLPRDILDNDIEYIKRLGVEIKTSSNIDFNEITNLKKGYQAVIIAAGVNEDRKLGIPGEELDGIYGCLSLSKKIYKKEITGFNKKVAVIGDGNSAFDIARTLIRLGAETTIISWFSKDMIPADHKEIMAAVEEGVKIVDSAKVTRFIGKDGNLTLLECAPAKLGKPGADGIAWPKIDTDGKPFTMTFDNAIVAIGQKPLFMVSGETDIKLTDKGLIDTDDHMRTNIDGIYAAGDAVTGPSSVINSMAMGRLAASAVLEYLKLPDINSPLTRDLEKAFQDIPKDIPFMARAQMPERQVSARRDNFLETALGLSESQILAEAERCLQCGVCSECLECENACQDIDAIKHDELPLHFIEHAGVIIIADSKAAPLIKGEDVIRAYGPKAAQADVNAMILRGFAAAAQAVSFLGGHLPRIRRHGLSFSLPAPQLIKNIRVGIFICHCNKAFGWPDELDDFINKLNDQSQIFHTEVIASACIPEGSSKILKTIRDKGLSRIILGSCVCCPLDFICSACTDQRSRLKDALFIGTGINRAMVETCNTRGEALRLLPKNKNIAIDKFKGLIIRSINKAKQLNTLPAPVRSYNFATSIIGLTEATRYSALTLADAGIDVFLLGRPGKPLLEAISHPYIHNFMGSIAKNIRGTLGDFQIHVQGSDFEQVLQVGSVILTEKSIKSVRYISFKGMPSTPIEYNMQRQDKIDIPFFYPGSTSIAGIYLANPNGINVSDRIKGSAAGILTTAIMPRGPRHNKGFTVVIDESKCRGCGRCINFCPYKAITLRSNYTGGYFAVVDEANCKGCGNCISVCPSNAADSPYRDQGYLEKTIKEILIK